MTPATRASGPRSRDVDRNAASTKSRCLLLTHPPSASAVVSHKTLLDDDSRHCGVVSQKLYDLTSDSAWLWYLAAFRNRPLNRELHARKLSSSADQASPRSYNAFNRSQKSSPRRRKVNYVHVSTAASPLQLEYSIMPRKAIPRPSTTPSTRQLRSMHSDRQPTADYDIDQQDESLTIPDILPSSTKNSTPHTLPANGSKSAQTPPPFSDLSAGIDEENGLRRSTRKRKASIRTLEFDEIANQTSSTKRRKISPSHATLTLLDENDMDKEETPDSYSINQIDSASLIADDDEVVASPIQTVLSSQKSTSGTRSQSPIPSRRSRRIAARSDEPASRKRLRMDSADFSETQSDHLDTQLVNSSPILPEANFTGDLQMTDPSSNKKDSVNDEKELQSVTSNQDQPSEVSPASLSMVDKFDTTCTQEEISSHGQKNRYPELIRNKLVFYGADAKAAIPVEQAYASDSGSRRGGRGSGRGGRGGNYRGRGGRGRGGASAGRGRGDSPERPMKQILSAEARAKIAHLKQRQGELRRFFAILGTQQAEFLDVLAARDIDTLVRKAKAHKKVPEHQEVCADLIAARDRRQDLIRQQYEMAKELAVKEFEAEKELIEQRWRTHVENVQEEHIRGAAGDIALLQRAYLGSGDEARTEDGSEVGFFPQYHEMPESDATVRGYYSNRIVDEKALRQGLPTFDELAARDVIDDEVTRPIMEALAKKRAAELEEENRQNEERRAEEARQKTQTLDALAEFALSEEAQKQLAEIKGYLIPQPARGNEVDTYALSELANVAEWMTQQHAHQHYIYQPPPEGINAFPHKVLSFDHFDPIPGRHYTLPPPPPPPQPQPLPQYNHWQPPPPPPPAITPTQQRPPSAYDPTLPPPPSSSPPQFRPLAAKAPPNGLPPPPLLPPSSNANSASARRSLRSIAPQPLNQAPPPLLHHASSMSLPPPPPSPISLAPGGPRPLPPLSLPPKQSQPPLIPPQRKQYTFVPLQHPPPHAHFSPIHSPAHSRSPSTSGAPGMSNGPGHPPIAVGAPNTHGPNASTPTTGPITGTGAGTGTGRGGGGAGRGGRGANRGVKAGQGKIPMQFVNSTVDNNGRRALLPKP